MFRDKMSKRKDYEMKKDLQNGRSMIEMLGVLSIIGILTVGGFSLVSKAVTENKINNVIDEISALAQRTRIVFREFIYSCQEKQSGSNKSCPGDTDMTDFLHKAKAYPDVLDYENSVFMDNEDIEMTVSYVVKDEVGYYVLKIDKIPEDICMGVANGNWGKAATNGFSGISFEGASNAVGGKVELDDAVEGCKEDGSSTIYLAFR